MAILFVGFKFWGIVPFVPFRLAILRSTDHRWCFSRQCKHLQPSSGRNPCQYYQASRSHCGNPQHWTNRITRKHPQAASIASHCTLDQVPLALSRNMALQPPLEIGKGQGVLKCGQRLKGKHRKNVVLPQHPQLKTCGTEMGSAACKFTTCFVFHIFHDLLMFFQHAWFWHLARQHTHYLSVQSKARIR